MKLTAEKLILDNIDKSSWRTYRFDQIAKNISERVEPTQTNLEIYVGLDHIDSDSIHIKRFGKREDVSGTKLRCYPGDVIFGRRRAYQRKAAIVTFDGFCSAHSLVLRANPDVILPELFPFFLHSNTFMHLAVDISVGSLSPTINWGDLKKQEFLLPPKDPQQQIAELLWAMDEVIEKGTSLENATKKFRESTFQEFVHHTEMSSAVQVKTLLLDGPTNGYSPESNAHGNGSQTVSIGSIREGVFDPIGNIKYAEVDPLIIKRYSIEQGDVFVVRGNGNKSLCGKAGIANRSYSNMFYPDLLIRLRFDESFILPSFATYQWNHATAHSRLLRSAKSSNGIWKINGKDIRQHVLIVPSLSTQRAIMNKVEQINSNLDLIRRKLNASKALQKSLTNQVF